MQEPKQKPLNQINQGCRVDISTLNYAVSVSSTFEEENITVLADHGLRILEFAKRIEREE
jgi:hypothetical protein